MLDFFQRLAVAQAAVLVTDAAGASLHKPQALAELGAMARAATSRQGKVLFIGNGGSAAIAAHMAVDWQKNGGIRTMAFNDAAMLTCLANDYVFDDVFARQVAIHVAPDDVVVLISTSGKSPNILKACAAALQRRAAVVTLTGKAADNELRGRGALNFYVPSDSYGVVEINHLAILHSVVDV